MRPITPLAEHRQYWRKTAAVRCYGVPYAWWYGPFISSFQDPALDKFVKVSEEHSFRDAWNATSQFKGAHRPL